MPPPFPFSKLVSLAKLMPLAAVLTMAELTTAPELLNWPTNDFTCSSYSLPMSKGLPLDYSDSTDTVSGLPSLQREYNLF